MRIAEYWRTTTFRLVLLYGAIFLVAIVSLLGLIYWRTAGYMTQQIDLIIHAEFTQFVQGGAEKLPQVLDTYEARDVRHVNLYGLFARDGRWITGNLTELPADLPVDGQVHLLSDYRRAAPGAQPARAMAIVLPWGETLVVGRDVTQLLAIRHIILLALLQGGVIITILGLVLGFALSLRPLRRAREMRLACERVVAGELETRLPVTRRRDELDYIAVTVNGMLEKIERLLMEVKSVCDNIAHDLRTPMTRLRARLYRLRQEAADPANQVRFDELIEETDAVLRRFKALLRVSEIEQRRRRQAFAPVRLGDIVEQVADFYGPLAEDQGKRLSLKLQADVQIEADAELLFEAISNLVDNAVKFSPPDGIVTIKLHDDDGGPYLDVVDRGPGIPEAERESVLQPFHRGGQAGQMEGSGLGLSIVAAIARLHGFPLDVDDMHPGTRVRLTLSPAS